MTSIQKFDCKILERDKINKLCNSIKQFFVFNIEELNLFESYVDNLVFNAENGSFKALTVDRAALRNKYFFGEGYTYGSQMSKKGPGMERVFPRNSVDPIPSWIEQKIIYPLIEAKIIPKDFVNCVTINDYQPGGCIVSHIDPPHIFDRPIVSLSLFSDSSLCFGCKFEFKPIRCSKPIFKLELPRGVITILKGFAANEITHCIRPGDIQTRRAVIILRRVHTLAPRLPQYVNISRNILSGKYLGSLRVPKELPLNVFIKFYENYSKSYKHKTRFGCISKTYFNKRYFLKDCKRYGNESYNIK